MKIRHLKETPLKFGLDPQINESLQLRKSNFSV